MALKIPLIIVQRLDDIIHLTLLVKAIGDLALDPYGRDRHPRLLICLFLAHDLGNAVPVERAGVSRLVHTHRLRIGGGAVVFLTGVEQGALELLVKEGELHADGEGDPALVHQVEESGDELGQADVPIDGIPALAIGGANFLCGIQPRRGLQSFIQMILYLLAYYRVMLRNQFNLMTETVDILTSI